MTKLYLQVIDWLCSRCTSADLPTRNVYERFSFTNLLQYDVTYVYILRNSCCSMGFIIRPNNNNCWETCNMLFYNNNNFELRLTKTILRTNKLYHRKNNIFDYLQHVLPFRFSMHFSKILFTFYILQSFCWENRFFFNYLFKYLL